MLVSKAEFYFQLHILSENKWTQRNSNSSWEIPSSLNYSVPQFSPYFPFSGPHNFFITTKKVFILNIKAEIHTEKKIVLILKINFFFEDVLPIYFQTYTMKKIPQEGQEQVLFLLVLVTFEKQLSPNRWLEAFNILHLLSLICLAQAPVEKFS